MATSLKLDDKLIDAAVKLGGFKTQKEAVNAALTEFVGRRNRLKMLELAGRIEFAADRNYMRMRGPRA